MAAAPGIIGVFGGWISRKSRNFSKNMRILVEFSKKREIPEIPRFKRKTAPGRPLPPVRESDPLVIRIIPAARATFPPGVLEGGFRGNRGISQKTQGFHGI